MPHERVTVQPRSNRLKVVTISPDVYEPLSLDCPPTHRYQDATEPLFPVPRCLRTAERITQARSDREGSRTGEHFLGAVPTSTSDFEAH
jgi:hypothetical protein